MDLAASLWYSHEVVTVPVLNHINPVCTLIYFIKSHFLGAFADLLRLLALSCLSVRMEQLRSHWTDCHEI
jgi:hypothetical protein